MKKLFTISGMGKYKYYLSPASGNVLRERSSPLEERGKVYLFRSQQRATTHEFVAGWNKNFSQASIRHKSSDKILKTVLLTKEQIEKRRNFVIRKVTSVLR